MQRRELLLHLSAASVLSAGPFCLLRLAPFTFLTDQTSSRMRAACIVRIPPNAFLSPSWHVGLRIRSLRAALGAANALLLMESLRDLSAYVHLVRRDDEIEFIEALLPEARR